MDVLAAIEAAFSPETMCGPGWRTLAERAHGERFAADFISKAAANARQAAADREGE